MAKQSIFVGTSGWMYKDWGKRFYPKKLTEDHLVYYAKFLPTVEINSSFYHIPQKDTFIHWHKKTPRGFVFSVKLNRYFTHTKKLILDEKSEKMLKYFLENSQGLKEKNAVVLIQLPPSFACNYERLEKFLQKLKEFGSRKKMFPRFAIEFRHKSWLCEQVYTLMRLNDVAMVISSSPEFPSEEIFTTDFSYIRFHGAKKLFSSRYLDKELDAWKEKIMKFPKEIKRVYAYFNNDYSAYAIDNALYLKNKLKIK